MPASCYRAWLCCCKRRLGVSSLTLSLKVVKISDAIKVVLACVVLSLACSEWHVPRAVLVNYVVCQALSALCMYMLCNSLALALVAFAWPTFGKEAGDAEGARPAEAIATLAQVIESFQAMVAESSDAREIVEASQNLLAPGSHEMRKRMKKMAVSWGVDRRKAGKERPLAEMKKELETKVVQRARGVRLGRMREYLLMVSVLVSCKCADKGMLHSGSAYI